MSLLGKAIESGRRTKSISFKGAKDKGTKFEGILVDAEERQATVYKSDPPKLQFWDKEETRPKMQLWLTLDTEYRDDEIEDDDGRRVLVLNRWGTQGPEFIKTVEEACGGKAILEAGAKISVETDGWVETKAGEARKFKYTYEPPVKKFELSSDDEDDDDDDSDDEPTLEEQIETFISMGWSDAKIRKALPDAKPKMIAALREQD